MVEETKKEKIEEYHSDNNSIGNSASRAKTTDNAINPGRKISIEDYFTPNNEFSFKTNGVSKDNQDAVKLHGVLRDSIATIDFELIGFKNTKLAQNVFNNLLYILSQIPDVSDEYEYNANLGMNVKKANPDLLEINKYINYAYYCIATNDKTFLEALQVPLMRIREAHEQNSTSPKLSQVRKLFLKKAINSIDTNNLFDFASVLKDWKQLLVTPDFPANQAGFKETHYDENLPVKYSVLTAGVTAANQTIRLNQPEESKIPICITKNNNPIPSVEVKYNTNFTLFSFGREGSIEKAIPESMLMVHFDINLVTKTRDFHFSGNMSGEIEGLATAAYDSPQNKLRIDFMIDDLNGRNPLVSVREFSHSCGTCIMAFPGLTAVENKKAADIFADMANIMTADQRFGRTDYINAVYCFLVNKRFDLALKFIELLHSKNKGELDKVCTQLKTKFDKLSTSLYDISASLANFSQPIITPYEMDMTLKDNEEDQRETLPNVQFVDQDKTADEYRRFRRELANKKSKKAYTINSRGDAIFTASDPVIKQGKPTVIMENPLTFCMGTIDLPTWFLAGNIQAHLLNQQVEGDLQKQPRAQIQQNDVENDIEIEDHLHNNNSQISIVERSPAHTQRTVTLSGPGADLIHEYCAAIKNGQDGEEILDQFIAEGKKAILVEKMLKLLEIQLKVQMKTALKPLLEQEKKLEKEKKNENDLTSTKRAVYAQLKQEAYRAIDTQLKTTRTSFIKYAGNACDNNGVIDPTKLDELAQKTLLTVNDVCSKLTVEMNNVITQTQNSVDNTVLSKHRHTIRNAPRYVGACWLATLKALGTALFSPGKSLRDVENIAQQYIKQYMRTASEKALIKSRERLLESGEKTVSAVAKAHSYGRLYSGSLNYILHSNKEKEQKISLDNPAVKALCKRTQSLGA